MMSNAVIGVLVATGIVGAGVGGYVVYSGGFQSAVSPDVPPEAPSTVAVVQAPESVPETPVVRDTPEVVAEDPAPAATPLATPAGPGDPAVPQFDIVRVDPAGGALVAGKGPIASEVTLKLDGQEVATARTDAQGNFVSLFDIPSLEAPQILTLESAKDETGDVQRATESVIVAPTFPAAPDVALDQAPERDVASAQAAAPEPEAIPEEEVAALAPEATVEAQPAPQAFATRSAVPRTAPVVETPVEEVAEAPLEELTATPDTTVPEAPTVVATAPTESPVAAAPQIVNAAPVPPAAPGATGGLEAPRLAQPTVETPAPQAATPPALAGVTPSAPPVAAATPAPVQTAIAPTAPAPQSDAPEPLATVAEPSPPRPSAPRLFRAGPSGLTVVSDGPAALPQANVDLGIDAIAYDAEGDVQLTGRGQGLSELRIYLDNEPVGTARVNADGAWSSPLPDVDTGVYTLRIDSFAADGSVVSRVETPFQRTAPEIAARLRREGATAITVQPGYTLWAISEGYFGDGIQYVQLFEANRDLIRDPDLIYPGQVFALPEVTAQN